MKKHTFLANLSFMMLCLILPISVRAAENNSTDVVENTSENKYYLGSVVNTGKDNGYSDAKVIGENDPHFGWNLGKFYVSGYTRAIESENDENIFLKNAGDTVSLWFSMEQDIESLNGDASLTVFADNNGYDQYFGIEKTNFGRGTLIIRHIDYQNLAKEPTIYTDYLAANITAGADTKVDIFEEGDYEVALNYELKYDPRQIWGVSIIPTYTNYRIFFRFSVRNGNCMVFPFDMVTGEELTNASITENGFYLDLAKSRYLDIDIKKEVLEEGAEGLTEDIRFNRPAKDGDQYAEEGIYTITVRNRYTNQETEKKIYVGTDAILKAHMTTGYPIAEIKACVANGGTIEADGTLTMPVEVPDDNNEDEENEEDSQKDTSDQEGKTKDIVSKVISILFTALKVIGVILVLWIVFRMIFPRNRRRNC